MSAPATRWEDAYATQTARLIELERENAELREELREIKRTCFDVAEVFGPVEGGPTALLLNGGVPAALLARARAKEAKP